MEEAVADAVEQFNGQETPGVADGVVEAAAQGYGHEGRSQHGDVVKTTEDFPCR